MYLENCTGKDCPVSAEINLLTGKENRECFQRKRTFTVFLHFFIKKAMIDRKGYGFFQKEAFMIQGCFEIEFWQELILFARTRDP